MDGALDGSAHGDVRFLVRSELPNYAKHTLRFNVNVEVMRNTKY